MSERALLPTTTTPRASGDPVFTAAFYAPYEAAARAALAMLCDIRAQLGAQHGVRAMTYRLKSPASIRGKLKKHGLPATRACAATLSDIVGLRLVLGDEGQVYRFARAILSEPGAQLVRARDYIAAPKPSGYRSLHLILRVPAGEGEAGVPVEIQLRTQIMDLWASAEHDACYKPV